MKKFLFALVALLPLLVSCGKEGKGDNTFEDPSFIQFAGHLDFHGDSPVNYSVSSTKAESTLTALQSIDFTESGLYAISERVKGELSCRMGTYTVNGNVYTLDGFGTAEFDHSASGAIALSLTPTGNATMDIQAEFVKATTSNQLYRGWTIDKTRVTVRGWTTASADFQGCNFYEIARFIRDNGHDAPDDISPDQNLRSISFTGTEKMLFYYSDGSADIATFQFNGNSFTYLWNGGKMGFTFLTDEATVEYMDGKCILTIRASIQDSTTSGSVTFVMSPMA